MKPQAELDNEKIRDMLDNFDSLSPIQLRRTFLDV